MGRRHQRKEGQAALGEGSQRRARVPGEAGAGTQREEAGPVKGRQEAPTRSSQRGRPGDGSKEKPRAAAGDAQGSKGGRGRSEPAQQPFDVLKLDGWPVRVSETAAKLLEDFTRTLDVDLVWDAHGCTLIGAFGPLRASQRITRGITVAAIALRRVLHHLFGHLLGTLAHLIEGAALFARCFGQIAVIQRLLGVAHGMLGVLQLLRAHAGTVAEVALKLPEALAKRFLPAPEALFAGLALSVAVRLTATLLLTLARALPLLSA